MDGKLTKSLSSKTTRCITGTKDFRVTDPLKLVYKNMCHISTSSWGKDT